MSLELQRINFGYGSHTNTISLQIEHKFGVHKSKRRKRSHKSPKLLSRQSYSVIQKVLGNQQ